MHINLRVFRSTVTLCGIGFHAACYIQDNEYPRPRQRNQFSGKLGFLCKSIQRTTSSCASEYEKYVAAKTRLLAVEKLPEDTIQVTLRQRGVQFEVHERKDSLVRKILVTGDKAAKKVSEIFHFGAGPYLASPDDVRVSSWSAPLAVLRNRLCLHGIDDAMICRHLSMRRERERSTTLLRKLCF